MITDFIKQFPPNMGEEVQYYYRRGCRFYFRTLDKTKTLSIMVSPRILEETKASLKFGSTYKCVLE